VSTFGSRLFDDAMTGIARGMDPETAHKLAVETLKHLPARQVDLPSSLRTRIAGLDLPSPVGLAAGFDKNAEVAGALLRRGFGFVEVGTVTPLPQPGNGRPRLFRLSPERALINRFGFNNDGADACLARLKSRQGGILGVNIGANKDSTDRIADYAAGVSTFMDVADYLTANISSPNTPGLRSLQDKDALLRLAGAMLEARSRGGANPPVFIKIAPDLDDAALDEVCSAALASGIDGLVISNTTVSRPLPPGAAKASEAGGLSGRPLFALSTAVLARVRLRVGARFPLIGVGGVEDAAGAISKIEAGANAVQLYTAMAFQGFGVAARIALDMDAELARRGVASLGALVSTRSAHWAAMAPSA
jgi:dihydroorotate dehydrogenase